MQIHLMSASEYGIGRETDSIISHLFHLLTHYHDLLEEEHMKKDVEQLIGWLIRLEGGEWSLENKIIEESQVLLSRLHEHLQQSAEDHQRLVEESPSVAENAEEEKSMRLLKASAETHAITQELLALFNRLPNTLYTKPAVH